LELETYVTTDNALIEKREELKRRLAAGEYKTLIDVFLEWFDRLIRKITRQSKSVPIWFIIAILSLIYYLITFMVSYYLQDGLTLDIFRGQGRASGLGPRFVVFSSPAFFIISMVVINQFIHRIFILWRDDLLDITESVTSLEDFENWLEKARNWRLHLLVTLGGAVLGGIYMGSIASDSAGEFMGYGFVFGAIFLFVYFYAFVYLILVAILLSARLRRYDLRLFAADPSSSELVSRLSSVLGSIVYFVAVLAAYNTLVSALIGLLLPLGIFVVLVLWLPIIALFVLNQTSLSSIIRRVKWKTLKEAQEKIEKLRASKNFGSPKTMDAISKLMDYHDRVKATRNSALNSGAILSFINSLLLPLLAFLLGNLDKLMALLPQRP
jgi:ABC-type multidrug transport system fused ATPase/permease subunit